MAGASAVPALAQQAVYPVVVDNSSTDPLLSNLSIPAKAAQAGMWSGVYSWPSIPIHASLLPDGRVLTYGAPPGGTVQDGRSLVFWDPRKGIDSASFQVLPNAQNVDSFCSSATLLSDGKLLVSGGASTISGFSSREGMVLDWRTSQPQRDYNLNAPRWYGTMTKLPDGRAIITGGSAPYAINDPNVPETPLPTISSTPEVYTPGQGWRSLVGAYSTDAFGPRSERWWYPRQWVSPAGTLFGISTEKIWEMRLGGNGSIRTLRDFKTRVDNNTRPNVGPTSTAVMFDTGRILQVGGNGYNNGYQSPSSAAATVFDINKLGAGQLTITETAPMNNPRQWANAAVLPNGRVLVTGGTRYADEAGNNAVLSAEIWDPASGRWTLGASGRVYRGYHSNSLLLPNGAVLVSGGGAPGPATNLNAEIYYPPYLFRSENGRSVLAQRPRIISLSTVAANFGQNIEVQTATGDNIIRVSLIAVGSVTHSFDSNQRRLKLSFTRTASGINVTMPSNPNLAPPGYYQLSTVDAAGVPSRGVIVSIGAAAPALPGATPATPSVPAPVNPQLPGDAATQIGTGAVAIAAGADGTIATANVQNNIWVLPPNGRWTMLEWNFKDVAIIGENRYYAVGTDNNVYRRDNNRWVQVAQDSRAVAASADGTVAHINASGSKVWVKSADDNNNQWFWAPNVWAKKIALVRKGSLYYIGGENNVWRSDFINGPVLVGRNAVDIAASSDGTITVLSTDGSIWRKQNDDNVEAWVRVSGTATRLATPNAGTMIYTDSSGNIYRR
ncbi:galactose oxidase-like domain-containing protein [Sphingobium sp. MK2]